MLYQDGFGTWSAMPSADEHHQLGGDYCAQFEQSLPSVTVQEETYFEQFLQAIEEQICEQSEQDETNDHNQCGHSNKGTLRKVTSEMGPRFHKCQCGECQPSGQWMLCPQYISNRLPYSGLKIDVIGRNSVYLSGPSLSLFVSLDESRNLSPTVAIIFHNNIRVLVHQYRVNPRRAVQRAVDIVFKQYSITFRTNSVSFTSESNLLTYAVDKSGCKTKICKEKSIAHSDFVTKQFQLEVGPNRDNRRNRRTRRHSNKPVVRTCKASPVELMRKCQLKSSPTESNLVWTIDEHLNIVEQPNGSLHLHNEQSELYLSVQRNHNSLSLQTANVCIILNKSGQLFVANKLKARPNQPAVSHIDGSTEMSLVRQDIEMLSRVPFSSRMARDNFESKPRKSHQKQQDSSSVVPSQSKFSLNRVMSSSDQFAICGIGGLLVKHRNRRAGLNQKNQICLL